MKKLFLLLLLPLFAGVASAQYRDSESLLDKLKWNDEMLNIMLDMRFDTQYKTGLEDGREFGFKGQTLKLWLEGEIIPGIRYRVRHRLNKNQDSMRDNLSGATDHAWVAFDFGRNKQWTIMAGKQSVQLGTFEYDYNPADIYQGTMVFDDFDGYKVGVNAAYRFMGQTVNLQVFNSDHSQFASEEYKNKAVGGSVLWEGSLFSDVVKTRWAYTLLQHSGHKAYSWITAGVQLNTGILTTELDYYFGDRNIDYTSVIRADDSKLSFVRDQSASANFKLNLGKWHPFIKGTWNNRRDKDLGSDAYTNWGVQAAVEFYPFLGHKLVDDLRFHVAYAYNDTDFKGEWSAMKNRDQHMIIAGMRWLFKVK